MRRIGLLVFSVILLAGLIVGCEKDDEITGAEPPDDTNGTGPVPDSLVLARTFPPLLANGIDETVVRATVVDVAGNGLQGYVVRFATSLGSITPFATTDDDGSAEATLVGVASVNDTAATVSATVDAQAHQGAAPLVVVSRSRLEPREIARALALVAAPSEPAMTGRPLGTGEAAVVLLAEIEVPLVGITLGLEAMPPVIPADGVSQSRIIATVMETTRRVPLEQQEVRFGATAGQITGRAETNASGRAQALLTGDPGESGAVITAYYGQTLTTTVDVEFSPLLLTLGAEDEALLADGASSTTVVARLLTEQGNPVEGAQIRFVATLGSISSSRTTDERGEARATLVAGSEAGISQITARFSDIVEAEAEVEFLDMPPTSSLLLRASPTVIPADGSSEAVLTATALDANFDPMPDGTPVVFSILSGTGQIVSPVQTTQGGEASATYVAGTTSGVVMIQATSGDATADTPVSLTPLVPGSLELTAAEASVLADGVAQTTITATVRDLFGNPPAPGTQVQFTTSRGVLEDPTPTDASGQATVTLRAERFITGTARVTARVTGLQQTIDIEFVSEDAAHVEVVEVEATRLGVYGSGDQETSTIHFRVEDRNGIPVDRAHAVVLDFSAVPLEGATDATVYPASATTNDEGVAVATANSGTISGVLEVRAAGDGLLAEPIRIAIHGDLPDPEHFSLSASKLNIAGLVYDGIRDTVTARVGDQYGNPVPEETAVWFATNFGLIQGSAGTDDHGEAPVDLVTAAPRPQIPGGDGLVTVCAQTISKSGDMIEVCGDVLWSGPTVVAIVEPDTLDVPNGESVTIVYEVRDANGNPLTEGTTITVTTTAGTLAGEVNVVLPDTRDPAYTTFQVTLSDDDPGLDQPAPVTVTVDVVSVNGNASASITGVVN